MLRLLLKLLCCQWRRMTCFFFCASGLRVDCEMMLLPVRRRKNSGCGGSTGLKAIGTTKSKAKHCFFANSLKPNFTRCTAMTCENVASAFDRLPSTMDISSIQATLSVWKCGCHAPTMLYLWIAVPALHFFTKLHKSMPHQTAINKLRVFANSHQS